MDRPQWLELVLRIVIVESLFMFSRVTSMDQGGDPAAGLLCISDCATCPVICSPPPSPPLLKPLTPPDYSKPPTSSPPVHHPPQQVPYYFKPPPESNYFKSPPPPQRMPPLRPPPPPPSFYVSWGSNPPPSAPSGYANVNPLGQLAPPVVGQRNSTYPYYYFYTAKATPLSPLLLQSKFIIFLVFLPSLIVALDIQVGK